MLAGAVIHRQQVARFGERFGAQGALAGSKDANRCIGYLTKYLTKQLADCHLAQTDAQQAHAGRSNRKRVRLGTAVVLRTTSEIILTCVTSG